MVCTVIVCLAMALILYMFIEAHQSRVVSLDIEVNGLSEAFEGYSIYFISDIHRRVISQNMLNSIDTPDIVVIGGDLTEAGVPFSRVARNVQKLSTLGAPLLFIWGNHDIFVERESLLAIFKQHQVILLENDTYVVKRQGEFLNLVGLGDSTNDLDCLEAALEKTLPGVRILLSHNPNVQRKLRKRDQIPLLISGHTHGGQIRLLGWGPREKGGVKERAFGTLIISNGYGTTSYPLRLGAKPDTLYLTLYRREET
ncbi:metallophosphoesterase [Pullulanibacillus camelliae]|nr:metallophosphoesterase [Pullulanibacillus camelliae]